jgi:hypothetical protein
MNERYFMKQICSRIMNKNNQIVFVGIITNNAKLITGLSTNRCRNSILATKIIKCPSVCEIFALIKNCDMKEIWHRRELAYITIESSQSVIVILPLTYDKEKFVVFLIDDIENNNLEPMIEEIVFGL